MSLNNYKAWRERLGRVDIALRPTVARLAIWHSTGYTEV
jgi:hypothetical protein